MQFKPYVNEDFNTYAELDISDLELENKEQLRPLLMFPIKSYNKLNAVKNAENLINKEWQYVFEYPSSFLNTLSIC